MNRPCQCSCIIYVPTERGRIQPLLAWLTQITLIPLEVLSCFMESPTFLHEAFDKRDPPFHFSTIRYEFFSTIRSFHGSSKLAIIEIFLSRNVNFRRINWTRLTKKERRGESSEGMEHSPTKFPCICLS